MGRNESPMKNIPGYTPERDIDKGGMTDLFVARDAEDERFVIRTIQAKHVKERKVRKAFEHGIKVLGQLDHPNIVRLADHARYRGEMFMAVEYHSNTNLRDRIIRKDPELAVHQLTLLTQLADALAYVHAHGYLHMDLKPENVLIRDDMHLILVDFDLAMKHGGRLKKYKTVSGTVSYLAPETLRDGLLGEESEVYSFGVTAYELLTFVKPFDASDPVEYRRQVADPRVKPPSPQVHRADIPKDLAAIVLNCLEKSPERRYPSMKLVHRALKALVK